MVIHNNEINTDKYIGHKIFEYRKASGMGRKDLAGKIGISQQQCHKYETGVNKVSASRLLSIADVFGVSINVFYEDVNKKLSSDDMSNRVSCLKVSGDLMKIKNSEHRYIIKNLIKTLIRQESVKIA